MQKILTFPKNIKQSWLIVVLSIIVGIVFGFLIHRPSIKDLKRLEGSTIRDPDPQYPLINSLLGYDNAEATNFGQLVDFKGKISDLINKEVAQGNASKISVYFRDLGIGRWISINEDETYSPASLLKVPLMISYYRMAETEPWLLSKQIKFEGNSDTNNEQTIQPKKTLEIGKSYTIDQLINEMITYSDNDSLLLLVNNIKQQALNKIYSDLDVFLPTRNGAQDFISVKNYSLFFRILYSSTYLNHYYSERALELLSKSEFKNGLVAGVPEGTVVAHKFGERLSLNTLTNIIDTHEFHDCGIVYYPRQPYLLCVMTKGNDSVKLQKTIMDISKLTYTELQNQEN